jgi:hypothetical protein
VEGRDFNRAQGSGPKRFFLSRRLTRARYSFLPNHGPQRANHARLIGAPNAPLRVGMLIDTPERLETRLTHRKQTTATCSNRYSSRHRSLPIPHESDARIMAALPETPERVETRVSHRKQKIGCLSTRHTPRYGSGAFRMSQRIVASARSRGSEFGTARKTEHPGRGVGAPLSRHWPRAKRDGKRARNLL